MTTGTFVRQQLGSVTVADKPAIAASSILLTSLRIGLPIATLLSIMLLIGQVNARTRIEGQPAPVTDVV